ncbi:MAG: DMT family transporter [Oscillospiraceae bacterium]|jgi:drug/metabolite transporter (DMT)-like permease
MNRSVRARSGGMLLLTALIWGVAFVAQSVSMDYISPFTFNAVRSLIGGAVLLPGIALLDRLNRKRQPGQQNADTQISGHGGKKLIVGGVACGVVLAVASSLQQFGIMQTTVGKAGFITALYIVIVPVLGLFFKRRVPPLVWLGVLVATGGMYLLCITESFSVGTGDLLMVACAVCFSVHILLIDHFSPFVDCVRMSCIQFFTCGVLCAIPMFLWEHPQMQDLFAAWVPVLYAGVLSCGVAYTLQVVGQKHTTPVVASLLLSLESVFSVLAAWVILRESLSLREFLGCLMVFCAIVLAQAPDFKRRGSPEGRKTLEGGDAVQTLASQQGR